MSSYGSPTRESGAASQRERMMSLIGAALGVLMFIWGFLDWLGAGGDGVDGFSCQGVAVIGLSLAAGLLAGLGSLDNRSGRGVDSAVPLAFAASAALVALGILIKKGDGVDAKVGLILGLITAIVQSVVLGAEWASRRTDAADTRGAGALGGSGAGATYAGGVAAAPGAQAAPPPATTAAPTQTYGQTAPPPPGYSAPPAGGTDYPPNP